MYVDPITKRFCKGDAPNGASHSTQIRDVARDLEASPNTRRQRLTTAELGAAVDEAERAVDDARKRLDAAECDLSTAEQALHVAREALHARVKL